MTAALPTTAIVEMDRRSHGLRSRCDRQARAGGSVVTKSIVVGLALLATLGCADRVTSSATEETVERTGEPASVTSVSISSSDENALEAPLDAAAEASSGGATQHVTGTKATDSGASLLSTTSSDLAAPSSAEPGMRAALNERFDSRTLDMLSATLDSIARASRRGEAAVMLRRHILTAFRSSSNAEFQAAVAKLPVTVVKEFASQAGRSGELVHYLFRGERKLSRFVPEVRTTDPSFAGDWARELPIGTGPSPTETEWTSLVSSEPASFCVLDDPQGGYFEGECATQEEIDAGVAFVLSLDAELSADHQEAIEIEQCLAERDPEVAYPPGPCLQDSFDDADAEYIDEAEPLWLEDGPASDANGWPELARANAQLSAGELCLEKVGPIREYRSCANDAAMAATAVVGWVGTKVGLLGMMTATTPPPASAVAWGVFFAGTVGWGAASAVSAWITCMNAT